MQDLMDKLVDSVVTAGNNVVPRIQEIVNTITRAAPEVIRRFVEITPQFAYQPWRGNRSECFL